MKALIFKHDVTMEWFYLFIISDKGSDDEGEEQKKNSCSLVWEVCIWTRMFTVVFWLVNRWFKEILLAIPFKYSNGWSLQCSDHFGKSSVWSI